MPTAALRDIYTSSGVNDNGQGFCLLSINGGDILGQLAPDHVRELAYGMLRAAEAAEADAAMYRVLARDDVPNYVCQQLIIKIRNERGTRETIVPGRDEPDFDKPSDPSEP